MKRLMTGLVLVVCLVASGCGSSSATKPVDTPQPQQAEPQKGKDAKLPPTPM
jgi:hypothetical protein